MKSIQVEDELLDKLKIIKGFTGYKNMTDVIRAMLQLAGYNKKFFTRLNELRKE